MSSTTAISGGPLAVLLGPGKIQDKPTLLKEAFEVWIRAQPPWAEGLSSGFFGAFQGAFLGSIMGMVTRNTLQPGGGSQMGMNMGGPLQQARNFAVMTGVNAGLNTYMRRARGVDDIQNSLVAAFGSGACFSLVSGMGATASSAMPGGTPNPLMGAFSAGVVFALFQGAFYKLGEVVSGPKTEEHEYARVKAMLKHLGLSKYEKNVKRAMLNDATIMLWDTPALAEAKVPPGPRLLILHHIDQYRQYATGPQGKQNKVQDLLNPAIPLSAQERR